jgi:hypothetical protein
MACGAIFPAATDFSSCSSGFQFQMKILFCLDNVCWLEQLELSIEWRLKTTALTGLELEWQPITIEMLAWI